MSVISARNGQWLFLLSFSIVVNGRSLLAPLDFDVDLVASAAEPRPIFVENVANPPGIPLPLVYSVNGDASSPESVASEKVEKVLKPALAFSYTNEKTDEAVDQNYDGFTPVVHQRGQPSDSSGEQSAHGVRNVRHNNEHGNKHQDAGGDFEKGGGKDFHSDHKGEFGEEGHKEYDGHHHHKKSEKGHHDKADDEKNYGEHGGHKKGHKHHDGYFGEHHKEEGGHKGSEYGEHGEHNKGHSTKGSHSIRKKDEFDKKTEFFEEDDESGEFEKHGGYHHEDSYKKGGYKKGDFDKGGSHKDHYGKESDHQKGTYHKEEQGHDEEAGHDIHQSHHTKHGEEDGEKTGKKWAYSEGHGTGGDGGGGGGKKKHGDDHGGKGSHSHVAYQVHELPPKQEDAKTVNSELKPISVVLERQSKEDEIQQSTNNALNQPVNIFSVERQAVQNNIEAPKAINTLLGEEIITKYYPANVEHLHHEEKVLQAPNALNEHANLKYYPISIDAIVPQATKTLRHSTYSTPSENLLYSGRDNQYNKPTNSFQSNDNVATEPPELYPIRVENIEQTQLQNEEVTKTIQSRNEDTSDGGRESQESAKFSRPIIAHNHIQLINQESEAKEIHTPLAPPVNPQAFIAVYNTEEKPSDRIKKKKKKHRAKKRAKSKGPKAKSGCPKHAHHDNHQAEESQHFLIVVPDDSV
ncbi:uncharacterized protein LOC132704686 [Cylas formicarius]|uniref:uncharacterized protein LOC132704686 n=1 Tax=Cylas formicarius TaxID=197179 RepID=UPI0029584B5F|nr:uncharacterized protein LOC132704686 [Cylas formicarius]